MTRGILFTKDKICIFKRIVDRVMKDKKTEAYELFLKSASEDMFMSYTSSVFGRYDFANANRLMYPIFNAIRFLAYK